MARVISTSKPIVVQKQRELELPPEFMTLSPVELEDRVKDYMVHNQIPEEAMMHHFDKRSFGRDSIMWEWWEVSIS